MDNKKTPKNPSVFYCVNCDFTSHHKGDYNKHILTAKHKKIIKINPIYPKINFICDCGKEYTNQPNLCRHKKKCNYKPIDQGFLHHATNCVELSSLANEKCVTPDQSNNNINISMILDIIKENQEIKNLLLEQNKQVIELHKENNILNKENNLLINKLVEREPGNINSNNTTNNINQKFNLNFFLNETCKDALNINEFLDNIQITFQDLMQIGDVGFVAGVSDIFIRQLHNLEISKRPLHCTDLKRETIYFKQDNMWNKDNTDNSKLKNIIEKIEYRNVVALRDWCNENPDAKVNNTDNNLLKDKIYLQTLQGDERTREKIIKNISKEIIIDKE